MAVGDLYKAVFRMLVHGQLCENAWWYRMRAQVDPESAAASNLAEVLSIMWWSGIDDVLSNEAIAEDFQVWNYTDGTSYHQLIVAGTGGITSNALPSQYCVGIKMSRVGVGWNYPRKRISGFNADAYENNGIAGAINTQLKGVANNCRLLEHNDGDMFEWVVIRPTTTFALGNPTVSGEGVVGTALTTYDATQNTRKG